MKISELLEGYENSPRVKKVIDPLGYHIEKKPGYKGILDPQPGALVVKKKRRRTNPWVA